MDLIKINSAQTITAAVIGTLAIVADQQPYQTTESRLIRTLVTVALLAGMVVAINYLLRGGYKGWAWVVAALSLFFYPYPRMS